MKRFIPAMLAVVFAGTLACQYSGTLIGASSTQAPYTLDDVYAAPITDLVGRRIVLETRVNWENALPICLRPDCPEDKYLASPITVFFEDGDHYIPERFQGQGRGNMFLVSEKLTKAFNEDDVEEYYFQGTLLDRKLTYRLTGTFVYRDWMGGGDPPVDDPDFIEQSNDVTYWSQTFEFRLDKLRLAE